MLECSGNWTLVWHSNPISVGSICDNGDWDSLIVFLIVVDGPWDISLGDGLNGLVVWELLIKINSILNLLDISDGVGVRLRWLWLVLMFVLVVGIVFVRTGSKTELFILSIEIIKIVLLLVDLNVWSISLEFKFWSCMSEVVYLIFRFRFRR